jgi:CRISPR/Cas system-associated exonuclease Cas4 (RecB family)
MKRDYQNNYHSVTQALGVLRKIGLEMWFKFHTAQFCDEASAKGKLIGTQIHEAISNYILKKNVKVQTEYGEEVKNVLDSFILFRKEHPEFDLELTEIPLTSEKWRCNGTMDAPLKREGIMVVGDWKSGECKKKDKPPIYDEHKAQVAAYLNFFNEIFKTNIENAIIVCFAKDKIAYNLYEMQKQEVDDYFNDMFLPALKILNHQKKYKGGNANESVSS